VLLGAAEDVGELAGVRLELPAGEVAAVEPQAVSATSNAAAPA
jgi:hypothetical protein